MSNKLKRITPSPRKVDTDASPLRGKGLCCPVVAKSLLSKSNVGSIAVFRAAFASLNNATAMASMGPNIACACSAEMSGVMSITLTEKRTILYDAFPTVKKPTIDTWIRKWTNYKPYKEGSRHSAEYHQTRELLLSLPNEMSIVEKRQYLQENVSGVPRGTISRWVRKWTGTKGRNNPTHPDHDKAHKYFLSLRSDIPLNKRIHLFRKAFPNVSPASRIKWIKKWTGETMPTGSPCHPDRPEIHDYFLSLPLNMPISEKRKRILEKFGDVVGRSLVNRWTHRWHIEITGSPPPDQRWSREPFNHWKKGKPAHNRRPEYDDARDFFFSLPTMIPSKEKSRQLIEKYRHIPRGTIYQWTSRWQSSLANSA